MAREEMTCNECGLDRSLPRDQSLEQAFSSVEDEALRLRCRVLELEQVIRAYCSGSATVSTLREVAETPA